MLRMPLSRSGLCLFFVLFAVLAVPAAAQQAAAVSAPASRDAGSKDPAYTRSPPVEVVTRDAAGKITVHAVRVQKAPRIDGVLDDPVYSEVPSIGAFVQSEPRSGEPAT